MSLCGLLLAEFAQNMSDVNGAIANTNTKTTHNSNTNTLTSSATTTSPPMTAATTNTTSSCGPMPQSVPVQSLLSSSSSSNDVSAAVQQQILLQHWTQQFQQQQQQQQQQQTTSMSPQPQPGQSVLSQPQQLEQQHLSYHPNPTTSHSTPSNSSSGMRMMTSATTTNTAPIPIVSSIVPLSHSSSSQSQHPLPHQPQQHHQHQSMMMMNKEQPSPYLHHSAPVTSATTATASTSNTNLYSGPLQQQQQQQSSSLLSQQWTAFLQHQQQQQKDPSQTLQQPLIGNLMMMGQPSQPLPPITNIITGNAGSNSGTDNHIVQQQPTSSISVQQQQLILQQLLANVMVAQQQQQQQQQHQGHVSQQLNHSQVTGVTQSHQQQQLQQQYIMNPFQHVENNNNASKNIAQFATTTAASTPAILSAAPTIQPSTALQQPIPQSNPSVPLPSRNTSGDNKNRTIADEIGTHTFTEGWKTMWDDEEDVDVDILDDPGTTIVATTTTSSVQPAMAAVTAAVAKNDEVDEEDWAPTPLSEIRAKQLKRQLVATSTPATVAESNKRSNVMPSGGGLATITTNQVMPVPGTTATTLPSNKMLLPVIPPMSQEQPSVLQQLQMSYLQQQSNLYQPSQHPPTSSTLVSNSNTATVEQHTLPQQQQHTVSQFGIINNSSNIIQPQLFGHSLSNRLLPPQQQHQLPPGSSMNQAQQHNDKAALKLPSTVMSPSVLASILPLGTRDRASSGGSKDTTTSKTTSSVVSSGQNNSTEGKSRIVASNRQKNKNTESPSITAMASTVYKPKNVNGAGTAKSSTGLSSSLSRVESPQDYLERIITLRGFIVKPGCRNDRTRQNVRIRAEHSGYDTTPSPLQLASFGTELVKAVHESDVQKLHRLLSAGLSPNPCNQFSDSIVDLVCKRANTEIFQCLVDHGCDLRVCDGFGRTPLHHCCWAFEFNPDIVTLLLQSDPQQLFMEDKRGQTPLEYVRPDQSADWIQYFEANANTFFPTGGSLPPIISLKEIRPNGHIADPPNALPVQLATAISSGSITPDELEQMDPVLRARFS